MSQRGMFDEPRCPHGRAIGACLDCEPIPPSVNGAPETSHLAALHAIRLANTVRGRVYRCIEAAGSLGRTEEEIERDLGLAGNTARPRVWELRGNPKKAKPPRPVLVVDTGITRPARSGLDTIAWVAVSACEEGEEPPAPAAVPIPSAPW